MTFVHLAFLPFLALAVVPIILHLLTLHRLRTVELSTYRFLFDSYVQQRRQMKFLEALLALLRTLFLLALVLVVCRPVVKHWSALFGGGSGREVVMLVDSSASMNAKTAGVSALDRAKTAALSVATRLGRDDRLTLIRVGSKPVEVFSRFSSDAETIREKIEALEPGPSRANLFAALSQAFNSRGKRDARPNVYLFTDSQANSWREVRDHGLDRIIPEGANLTIVNVGSDESMGNRGVVGDAPRQRQAIRGLPVVLRPRVVNRSKTEPADVTVGVFLDEKEVARTSVTLRPGETSVKEIVYVPTESGVLRGRFEIAPDRFPDDDSYLFTLPVAEQVKVLLVNGNPAADPFENEALFLRTALTANPEGENGPATPNPTAKTESLGPGREFVRSLDLHEINEGQLNADLLRDSSVAILANCGSLNATHFGWLRDFVSRGGGLIVLPGERVNPDTYTKQFFPVPGPQNERLTAATLAPPEGDLTKAETFERLASIDFSHPALAVFDEPDGHYLTTAQFYRRFPIALPEARGQTWPLARFANGAPALVESRFGDGLVLLAAFPANTKWTNLPLKPEFVPLVLRFVSHVRQSPDLDVPSVVPPDGAAEIAVAGTWAPATGKIVDTKGRASTVNFERSATKLLGEFEETTDKGYYAVEVRGGRPDPPQKAAASFAVNTAPEESNFETVGESQVRDWLPRAHLTYVNASAEAQQAFGSIGDEREVWRPLIFVLFALIGAEFLLATMGGPTLEAGEQRTVSQRIRDLTPGTWIGRMTGAGAGREAVAQEN
jgi:hypothetical protein